MIDFLDGEGLVAGGAARRLWRPERIGLAGVLVLDHRVSEAAMNNKSRDQIERDNTLIAAGALIVAAAIVIGFPPWLLFGV
ncbi:hypothetical protein [Shinella sp. M31]|uniref:hypothetical protein n=1 Tax=Shinella sp. M31 TaxID=3368615 RepID=UPI003B9F5065